MERPVGFEPTTSRVSIEVSGIFTTDRAKVLPGNGRPLTRRFRAARRARITSAFRVPKKQMTSPPAFGKNETLGNGRIRFSVMSTQVLPCGRTGARDTTASRAASTVRDTKGGIRTHFSRSEVSEIFTTSAFQGNRRNADWSCDLRFTDDGSAFFTTRNRNE